MNLIEEPIINNFKNNIKKSCRRLQIQNDSEYR